MVDHARREVAHAIEVFGRATVGSNRPERPAALARWDAASTCLDRMVGRILSGSHAIDIYLNVALGVGPSGGVAVLGSAGDLLDVEYPDVSGNTGRLSQVRQRLVYRGDDVLDATRNIASSFRRLPTQDGPTTSIAAAPASTPDLPTTAGPDIATGLMAAGIVAGEGVAAIGRMIRRRRRDRERTQRAGQQPQDD